MIAVRLNLVKEQLHALTELLEQDYVLYHHGYTATELRKLFVQQQLPGFVKEEDVYERVKEHTNPARKLLTLRGQGVDLEDIILEYAAIG